VSTAALVVTVLVAVSVLLVAGWCVVRANRLDRLHVRTDAARAALVAALERRAVVARSIAVSSGDDQLRVTASAAEQASAADREPAENDLSRRLARLDRAALPAALLAELGDAEQRVMLARRVHNDAVRDTLALRSRRLVRLLRLAGTAPAPQYFEIADEAPGDLPVPGDAAPASPPVLRRSGRVVLVDALGRTLLFEGFDPARPEERYWFTPGGGLRPGEDPLRGALRELAEETGVSLTPDRLVGPVWRGREAFSYEGATVLTDETYFLATSAAVEVDTSGFTELERACVVGHRWWSVGELRASSAVVFPRELADLLEPLLEHGWDGVTRSIS
jgi:8-oxo-dGTP pyrophosphatase MutT (NUDIX family)